MSNYIYESANTKSFYTMAWIAFIISFAGMAVGLATLSAGVATKGFIGMSYLFSVVSCFTVAKVVRDRHEESKFVQKLESAKTEKFLNEHHKVDKVF